MADIVIAAAARTPVGSFNGAFASLAAHELGAIGLVSDRGHQGSHAGGRSPHECLVAEHEEVLEVAAAAGDDDDLDLGIGVEHLDRRGHLGGRPVTLALTKR